MNNTAKNMGLHTPHWQPLFISFVYTPRSGIAGLCGLYLFNFQSNLHIVSSLVAGPVYNLIHKALGLFSLHFSTLFISCFLNFANVTGAE